jgi:hypothetical protein
LNQLRLCRAFQFSDRCSAHGLFFNSGFWALLAMTFTKFGPALQADKHRNFLMPVSFNSARSNPQR